MAYRTRSTRKWKNEAMDTAGKREQVRKVFESISSKYDLIDTLISFAQDQRWRRKAVSLLGIGGNERVVDCGAGTGKVTRMIREACPGCQVYAVDITEGMLSRANIPGVRFILAPAENIPIEDSSIDAVISAFLTRNLESLEGYFSEAFRILRPGGRFVNLDIFNPTDGAMRILFPPYFYRIVPAIGDLLTSSSSYSYLARSVRGFRRPEEIAGMISSAGFRKVETVRLAMGTVWIHRAFK